MIMRRYMGVLAMRREIAEEMSIMDFAIVDKLSIVNSYFKKKKDHLAPFKSGNNRTQIDYFLMRAGKRRLCKDCKVIPSECLIL